MTFGICFKIKEGGGYKWNEIGHEMTIVESESWAHGGLLYHSFSYMFEISILKKVLKKLETTTLKPLSARCILRSKKVLVWGLASPVISLLIFVKVEAHPRGLSVNDVVSEIYRQTLIKYTWESWEVEGRELRAQLGWLDKYFFW